MAYSSKDFFRNEEKPVPSIVTRPGDGEVSVQPSSVDLHLGNKFGWYKNQKRPVTVSNEESYPELIERENDTEILVSSGEFILAHTEEHVHLPKDAVGFLHGRSSVGRLGLFVHNAGLVDAGFAGDLTLELYNASRNTIALDVGMRICQMTLHAHENAPEIGYSDQIGSKYQEQKGPTPSKLYEDF